jgi:sec-independent protein translocase protein TatB
MFGISWNEYILIAIVALIVIGPKELPRVLRAVGQWTAKIRRMAAEFQGQFHEALREAEMADLKQEMDNLNATAKGFTSQFDDPLNFQESTKESPKKGPDPEVKPEIKAESAPEPGKSDEAAKLPSAPPESAPAHGAEQTVESAAAPVMSEHPLPEMAGASAPTSSEGSSSNGGDGGVHA